MIPDGAAIAAILVALGLADVRRWMPWLAQLIVRRAARRFEPPHRERMEEQYLANVAFAEGPLSTIAYAVYTYVKAPFRARELRGDHDFGQTAIAPAVDMAPRLGDFTTLRLGGPAGQLVTATSADAIAEAVRDADANSRPVLVLGGGSNVLIADAGFPGTVVHVASRGWERRDEGDRVVLAAEAGESLDSFVEACVRQGLSGVECLSGIPGSVGAVPIQNVGAYGQEASDTVVAVRVLDRETGTVRDIDAGDCGFTYRSSVFKRTPGRWFVLGVTFELRRDPQSAPLRYTELARVLGVEPGERAPLRDVREAVLRLRRGRGMLVDPDDPDTTSAGSFFTNPILDPPAFAQLEQQVAERLGPDQRVPRWPEPDGRMKTPAAWLIERAGFTKGYGDPATVAISSKHTLALTNRGGGTTTAMLALAQEIAGEVHRQFGVALSPEPVLVGTSWDPPPRERLH
jgi:UDP-N-acetylmuramate dehydrogenase